MANKAPITGASGAGRSDARRNRVRILEAAARIFAEQGASASTEAVAARAGVAIGTVFRHFPTKPDLLSAVVMNAWEQLVAELDSRLADVSDGNALLSFCTSVMTMCATNREVLARLAETGSRVQVADALLQVQERVQVLLEQAQKARVVREDLLAAELIALLAALCQEAMNQDWDEPLRARVLDLLFQGLG
ncbi:MAG: TetR/AcrR family transcriptional regulator [Candidatus Sericytochromatia bacterium]